MVLAAIPFLIHCDAIPYLNKIIIIKIEITACGMCQIVRQLKTLLLWAIRCGIIYHTAVNQFAISHGCNLTTSIANNRNFDFRNWLVFVHEFSKLAGETYLILCSNYQYTFRIRHYTICGIGIPALGQ